ncbi:MAG: 4Fe-4S dicluster domain-containing protein [Planctomycetota bacterium]|jgi:molybdopterin-containing oxidoreductase family iron-sulfur binding subunit
MKITTQTNDSDMPAELKAEVEQVSRERRDFMKVTGMAAMAATVAGCTADDRLVKPLFEKPEGVTPGVQYHYATALKELGGSPVFVKVRDGRPIKVEGHPHHPVSRGGCTARAQAALWDLYDSTNPDDDDSGRAGRLKAPMQGDKEVKWDELDKGVAGSLAGATVLTGTVNGSAARATLQSFLNKHSAKHVTYDAVSASAISDAHEATHGLRAIPHYQFDQAAMIVSFDADFLGTWISPVEFSKQWARGRDLKNGQKSMSRHIQFEGRFSITGGSADIRHRVPGAHRGAILTAIANGLAGSERFGKAGKHAVDAKVIDQLVKDLKSVKGRALVVSGSQNLNEQKLVNFINETLGSYGKTIDLVSPSYQKLGSDKQLEALVKDMEAGKVKSLIIYDCNPVYNVPGFKSALEKVGTKIFIGTHRDETGAACDWTATDHNEFEQWTDYEPIKGMYTLAQPTIRPLYGTRAAIETFAKWAGVSFKASDGKELVQKHWKANLLGNTSWNSVVESGFHNRAGGIGGQPSFNAASVNDVKVGEVTDRPYEVVAYESYNIGDGRMCNNGWLHETPDPMTRICWTNFASMSPATMEKLEVEIGDFVTVKTDTGSVTVPVARQPGAADGVIAIGLGFGRTHAGRIAHGMYFEDDAADEENGYKIGDNAYLLGAQDFGVNATVSTTGETYERLARISTHDSQEDRPIVKSSTLDLWKKNQHAGNFDIFDEPSFKISLWNEDGDINDSTLPGNTGRAWHYNGHKWGMVVDQNLCTGCNACVTACNIENNIPVVGKDEVWRRREMHWIRIDAYYSDELNDDGIPQKNGDLTTHENPEVGFQPMMCQHCENAPCETVCPVIATSHSEEGLNVQAYNRCIGTRYCANNCPYKVRRFNWFNYRHDDITMNLSLNPDITIRFQGTMEKCSMCAQRIYAGKREAAKAGRRPEDGSIRVACQSSCPTDAIIFGDQNDESSRIYKLNRDPRNYAVMAPLNTRPGVTYLTKIRNRDSLKHEEESFNNGMKVMEKATAGHKDNDGHDH